MSIALGVDTTGRLWRTQRPVAALRRNGSSRGSTCATKSRLHAGPPRNPADRIGAKATLDSSCRRAIRRRRLRCLKIVSASGLSVDAVLPTGAYDSSASVERLPVAPAPQIDLIRAARRAFPHTMVGGGCYRFSGFNRNHRRRKPISSRIRRARSWMRRRPVGDGDDRGAVFVFASARARGGNRPYRIGRSGKSACGSIRPDRRPPPIGMAPVAMAAAIRARPGSRRSLNPGLCRQWRGGVDEVGRPI